MKLLNITAPGDTLPPQAQRKLPTATKPESCNKESNRSGPEKPTPQNLVADKQFNVLRRNKPKSQIHHTVKR